MPGMIDSCPKDAIIASARRRFKPAGFLPIIPQLPKDRAYDIMHWKKAMGTDRFGFASPLSRVKY
jgi:hypothetical protein